MKLVGYIGQLSNFTVFRDLGDDELAKHDQYTPAVAEAHNRLKLFRILDHNFRQWSDYLNTLLSTKPGDHDEEMLHLDRLLLNYLTCAYTIREHFEVSFQQRFRKDEAKQKEYRDFLDRLCAASWAVAFFFDFRGYVQHVGLGIGLYRRNVTATSVTLTIIQDAAKLVSESRDWKRSKLSGSETIDLVPLLHQFHVQMLQSYAGFVVRTFFPELIPAAEFYGQLTHEVQQADRAFKMVFADSAPKIQQETGGTTKIELDWIAVPNALFAELGIAVVSKEMPPQHNGQS
jgi:hypothetical protein